MHIIKQMVGLLMVATAVAVGCYFLPFFNRLFEDYIAGFFVVAVVLPIGYAMYKSHMVAVAKLPSDVRAKKEKESQEQWDETCEATFSPSQPLDLRNMTEIRSIK